MTEIHSIREIKDQSKAGMLSIIALLFLPLIGLLCLFWPEDSAHYLPYVLGTVMVLSGVGSIIVAVSRELKGRKKRVETPDDADGDADAGYDADGDSVAGCGSDAGCDAGELPAGSATAELEPASADERESRASAGTAIVMCVLGAVILTHGSSSISFVGVMWGLLGLYKAGEEFDEIIHRIKTGRRFIVKLAFSIFELVLAVLLILHPFTSIDHHMILLGIELITYPFKIDRKEDGKFTLEAEA